MNTFEQMFALSDKLHTVMNRNRGLVTLTFYDGRQITVRVISANTDYNFNDKSYTSTITTFTNDINQTTQYDFGTVQDIN